MVLISLLVATHHEPAIEHVLLLLCTKASMKIIQLQHVDQVGAELRKGGGNLDARPLHLCCVCSSYVNNGQHAHTRDLEGNWLCGGGQS